MQGVSHKVITIQSDFVDLIEPYDAVLADRGFSISDELTRKRATMLYQKVNIGLTKKHLQMFILQKLSQTGLFTLDRLFFVLNAFEFSSTKYLNLSFIILMTLSKLLLVFVTFTLHFLVLKSKTKILLWKIYSMWIVWIKVKTFPL